MASLVARVAINNSVSPCARECFTSAVAVRRVNLPVRSSVNTRRVAERFKGEFFLENVTGNGRPAGVGYETKMLARLGDNLIQKFPRDTSFCQQHAALGP